MRWLLLALLLCGCTASAQSRPTVTPVNPHPTAQLDPGVIVWPFPLTPEPSYPPPMAQASTQTTLVIAHEPTRLRVTWSAPEPVCPWLESGAVKLYAGGAEPCRASGSVLLSYVPDLGARVVLRDAGGVEIKSAPVDYTVTLPIVIKP